LEKCMLFYQIYVLIIWSQHVGWPAPAATCVQTLIMHTSMSNSTCTAVAHHAHGLIAPSI
jgi:hypothetical protein